MNVELMNLARKLCREGLEEGAPPQKPCVSWVANVLVRLGG